MSTTLREAARLTATLANGLSDRRFTDPEIKEFLNAGLRRVQGKLQENGAPGVITQVDAIVPASTGSSYSFSLPDDFAIPIRLWEQGVDGSWMPMQKVRVNLPQNAEQSDQLIWWDWKDNALWFVPCSNDITIRILYYHTAAAFDMPWDTVDLPGLTNILAFAAVSLAAEIVAPERAQSFWARMDNELATYINNEIRTTHNRPFRRRRRRFGIPVWRY